MFRRYLKFTAAAMFATLALAGLPAHAQQTAKVVPDFTVFLDPPTGFVFVKLPAGWKFVGKADLREGASAPAGVVTSLLEGKDDAVRERLSSASGAR